MLFLVLVLFMNYKNVNTLINPVMILSQRMLMAARGNLDCKVVSDRQDEIGLLESSFNKMIDDLKHSIEVIGEKEAKEQQIRFHILFIIQLTASIILPERKDAKTLLQSIQHL